MSLKKNPFSAPSDPPESRFRLHFRLALMVALMGLQGDVLQPQIKDPSDPEDYKYRLKPGKPFIIPSTEEPQKDENDINDSSDGLEERDCVEIDCQYG